MATATFERQAELLEMIHACRRELQELAGDALEIIVRPSPGAPPSPDAPGEDRHRPTRELGRERAEIVLTAFGRVPGEWVAMRQLPELTGLTYGQLKPVVKRLLADGALEHNGESTAKVRYRLPEAPPGSSNGHRLTPRVRKLMERGEQQPVEPQPDPASPLERVRRACVRGGRRHPHRAREAARLPAPRRRVSRRAAARPGPDRQVRRQTTHRPRRLRSNR